MKITLDKALEMLREDPNAPVEGSLDGRWRRLRRAETTLKFLAGGRQWTNLECIFSWIEFRTIRTVTIQVPDDVEVIDGKITLNGEYGVEK